jgi:hypothetical protein
MSPLFKEKREFDALINEIKFLFIQIISSDFTGPHLLKKIKLSSRLTKSPLDEPSNRSNLTGGKGGFNALNKSALNPYFTFK